VGNLSAAQLLGTVPLADPFAVLQMLVARHPLASEVLLGAAHHAGASTPCSAAACSAPGSAR
jgi:ferredoxin-type protein NapH